MSSAEPGQADNAPQLDQPNDFTTLFGDFVGRRVGPYLIEARLGGGAMAAVYRASDQRSGQRVALKVMMHGADATLRERFRQEVRLIDRLTHPGIVPTLQVSQTEGDGVIYIAMELVDGPSLGDLLDRSGVLNMVDSCALLAPVARALAYAHSQGVVHRDVKPSNILLRTAAATAADAVRLAAMDRPVTPLLSDFGIARALDAPELTSVGRTIGTPAYMAPEQCAGSHDVDGRADIYALGAVLYRCLVGRAPFTGGTTQILYAHVYEPVTIPDELMRTLSPLVLEILRRSLAKQPDERYTSANDMAVDLTAAAGRTQLSTASAASVVANEATMTLPDLAATEPPTPTTLRVIVPAARPAASGVRSGALPASQANAPRGATAPIANPVRRDGEPAVRRLGARRRGLLLGVALMAAVLVLSLVIVNAVLPDGAQIRLFRRPTSTPEVVAAATSIPNPAPTTAAASAAATRGLPKQTATAVISSSVAVTATSQPTVQPTVQVETTVPPTPLPTPVGDIGGYWDDANAFYAERDWVSALRFLTLVQRIDANFEKSRATAMRFDIDLGLADARVASGEFGAALTLLDDALKLRPNDATALRLQDAIDRVVTAAPPGRSAVLKALQYRYISAANSMLLQRQPCMAWEQMSVAARIAPDAQVDGLAATLQQTCELEQQRATLRTALENLPGSFLYSAVQDGRSQIFTMPAAFNARSVVIIDSASQPARNPDGSVVAFYSTRADAQGLAGFRLNIGANPLDRSVMYTGFTEDSRDSPPSWSPDGARLAYASTSAGDRRTRVYVVNADGRGNGISLANGQSPAWHPLQNQIVFNGVDNSGQRPGLWLIGSDGANATPLTDVASDLRPVWSPDGSTIVFMSSSRDGNWEIYALTLASGEIARLTDDPAQDGLPAVSPDGNYVAFMSDRGGVWRIWITTMAGVGAEPLALVAGAMPAWLEHALQWVK